MMPPANYIVGFLIFAGLYVLALIGTMGYAVILFYIVVPLLAALVFVAAFWRMIIFSKSSMYLGFFVTAVAVFSALLVTSPLHGYGYESGLYFRYSSFVMPLISTAGVFGLCAVFDRIVVEPESNVIKLIKRAMLVLFCFFCALILLPAVIKQFLVPLRFLFAVYFTPLIGLVGLAVALWIVSDRCNFERWIFFVFVAMALYVFALALDGPKWPSPGRLRGGAFIILPPASLICCFAIWRLSMLIRDVCRLKSLSFLVPGEYPR